MNLNIALQIYMQNVLNIDRVDSIDAEDHLGLARGFANAEHNSDIMDAHAADFTSGEYRYKLTFGAGDFFFNREIVFEDGVGLWIEGQGAGYQLGETDYSVSPFKGQVTRLINVNSDNAANQAVIRSTVSRPIIKNIQLQGQRIPTTAGSGTGTICEYGLVLGGVADPPSGGGIIENVSAVNCTKGLAAIETPAAAHADSTLWNRCFTQGCPTFFYSNNLNAVHHTFIAPQIVTYGSNPLLTAFDIYQGGFLTVVGLALDCPKVIVLNLTGYSHNTNYFRFYGLRYDTPVIASPQLTLANFAGTADANYKYDVQMDGMIANITGDTYTIDPANLLLGFDTQTAMQDRLRFRITNLQSLAPTFVPRFFPEPFTCTTTERDAVSGYKRPGLPIYNSTTGKLNFWDSAAWRAVTST